jgi:hypothetical protein
MPPPLPIFRREEFARFEHLLLSNATISPRIFHRIEDRSSPYPPARSAVRLRSCIHIAYGWGHVLKHR